MSRKNSPEAKAARRAAKAEKAATALRMEEDIAMFNAYLVVGFMLKLGGSDWLGEQQGQQQEEDEPS